MEKIKSLLPEIRHRLYKNGYIFAVYFIAVGVMYLAYACFEVWPFGDRSVLALDLNAQYVYYYTYVHDVIHSGESIFYSWSRNLSGEFVGIIAYYLASPFNILVWLFPRAMITEGLLTMILAKFGVCASIFAFYLHKAKGLKKTTALIFAPCYALCGYMVVQTMDPMWLDGVLILPLVCYGIESLIKEYRFRLLIGALIYAFISNFYIGFMIAIFSVLYFLAVFFGTADYGKKGVWTGFIKKGCLFGASGITSALCSCFLLLPTYYSLGNGKFEFTNPDYTPKPNFDIVNFIQKLFFNTYDTVNMQGLPIIYSSMIALLLFAVYFTCKKVPANRRIATAVLMGALVVCMLVRPVDMIWHGGQMPNWLPYRYSFTVSFIIVSAAAVAFDNLKYVKGKALAGCTALILGIIVWIDNLDTLNQEIDGGTELFDALTVVLPSIGFIVLFAIVCYIIIKCFRNKKLDPMLVSFIVVAVCFELCTSTLLTLNKMHKDITFSNRYTYTDRVIPLYERVEQLREEDPGFYRIEKTFYNTVNDAMGAHMYGLSHSSSTLNAKAIDMLGKFGFTSGGHYTRFTGATSLTTDLFSVKYVISTKNDSFADVKGPEDFIVTKNENALPIMYLTSNKVQQLVLDDDKVFDNQNSLLSYMLGDEYTSYFTTFTYDSGPVATGCKKGGFEGNYIGFTEATDNAKVTYTLTAPVTGDIYTFFPTIYQREVSVYVNDKFIDYMFEGDNHNIKCLGHFNKGDEINLELRLNRDDLYFREPTFAVISDDMINDGIGRLLELNKDTTVEKLSGTHVRATINSDTDRLLYTTIPYEKGWTVTVDGKQVEPVAVVDDALMAIPVTAGSHTVEFNFFPAGMPAGILFTFTGICIFAIMIMISIHLKRPVKLQAIEGEKSEEKEAPAENTEEENKEKAEDTAIKSEEDAANKADDTLNEDHTD